MPVSVVHWLYSLVRTPYPGGPADSPNCQPADRPSNMSRTAGLCVAVFLTGVVRGRAMADRGLQRHESSSPPKMICDPELNACWVAYHPPSASAPPKGSGRIVRADQAGLGFRHRRWGKSGTRKGFE